MKRLPGLLLFALMVCFSLTNAQQVRVFNNLPESCRSGEQCIVEIVIEKSVVEGFARIQQILPEGFSAELVNDAGSDFIFDKQRVSFIWLSLPAGEVVKVSYKLTYGASLKGKFEIGEGTFSYLQENKLQKLAMAPETIWVNMKPEVAEPTPVAVVPVVREEPKVTEQKPVQEQPVAEKQPVVEARPVQEEPKAIELKPLKEQTPEAPTTVPVEAPVKEEPKAPEPPAAKEESKVAIQPPVKAEPKAPEPKPVAKEPAVQPVTPLPVSYSGTTFRVQFAALKTQRDVESLRKQFNITEQVFHEAADGWNRYTFGPFASQADAEVARKAYISKNGGNAIVVRYQDGKRAQ